MKKLIAICTIIISFHLASSAQGSVKGIVKDSSDLPVASASVLVYKESKSKPLTTVTTNAQGSFMISNLDQGAYSIIISSVGFRSESRKLQLTSGAQDIGTIRLSIKTDTLQGVSVTSKAPPIQQTDDKTIYNVESDPASKTQSALDLLRKTPFVSVDGSGNILVNGQANFRILLNGKETGMFANNVSNVLEGFPGANISKIEVITNPSAKYDAEGVGGIINIVTKKSVTGYKGSITGTYLTNNSARLSSNFNGKFGKFGFTLNYGLNRTFNLKGTSLAQVETFNNPAYKLRTQTGKSVNESFFNFGNSEINYSIDSLHIITLYGSVNGGTFKRTGDIDVITQLNNGNLIYNDYLLQTRNSFPAKSIGTDFIKKYKNKPDKELSVRLYGEFNINDISNNSFIDGQSFQNYTRNESEAKDRQLTFQTDYIVPLKKEMKLEIGLKMINRHAEANFFGLYKNSATEDYKINPANTDIFRYNQRVYSGYGSYNFKIKKLTFRTGLRLEHTVLDGDFITTQTKIAQEYTTWVPNLLVSAKIAKIHNASFSYNLRIQRPFIGSLNPFIVNNDSLNISFGNPRLQPQKTHTFSLQNRFTKGKLFMGITFTASYSGNAISRYVRLNEVTGGQVSTSDNVGKVLQTGLTSNITLNLNKKWAITANGSMTYYNLVNKLDTDDDVKGFGGFYRMGTTFTVNSKITLGLDMNAGQPPPQLTGKFKLLVFYTTTAAFKVLKEKLTINLGTQNLFKKYMTFPVELTTPNFRSYLGFTNPIRYLSLGLTWNFGKLKDNVSKKKGVTNDDTL